MKTILFNFTFGLILLSALIACKQPSGDAHFLTDESYRAQVHEQYLKRKELAASRSQQLFTIMEKEGLTTAQREALEFLYAYMPLSDLADYDGDFFLKQVDASFAARDYFKWGKTIPEDIFRHFVMVYRINNEDLDTARIAFFNELKERVKDMSMTDAALEVNHWCHEKVTYRGTDSRTSAPLALTVTSWGRCGEESTFTTAALRAVGIPARQCYTPRWAHTDDNHAWVEVWVDGQWNYLGACEPEPMLNCGWFSGPAKRAMMVHTNVFGMYTGPEEKNLQTDLYSKINLLSNYATTRTVKVSVVDNKGQAVEGARVQYKVFNYAEFYPIAESVSDKDGKASIISGLGDLLVWASKDAVFGYVKSSATENEVQVQLNKESGEVFYEQIVMTPPAVQKVNEVPADLIARNAKRLIEEDGIRNAYMATFIKEDDALKFAQEQKLDGANVWKYLHAAQGNWLNIANFMRDNASNADLFPFLASLSDKDLRDTPPAYLNDHLLNGRKAGLKAGTPESMAASYVLSPRIGLELIRPWRGFFQTSFEASTAQAAQANVQDVVNFVKQRVKLDEDGNYYRCPISPRGVYELGLSDKKSRDIFFTALCRTAGIAARVEQSTGKPQYYDNNQWNDANFEQGTAANSTAKASLTLSNSKANIVKPEYSTHFSIGRFKDGDFVTLDFEGDPTLKTFPCKLSLDPGYYRLMMASRANDGSATINTSYFVLSDKESRSMELMLPEVEGKIQILGTVDMNAKVTLSDGSETSLKSLSSGKGVMLCFAEPDKEPSKHVLQDLPVLQAAFNEWGGGVLFLVPNDKLSSAFDAKAFKNLPQQTKWGVDDQRALLKTISKAIQLDFSNNFPLTLFISDNGGILFASEGYRIGLGENIIKTIRRQ